jgi:SAM-dependent methyltransferase
MFSASADLYDLCYESKPYRDEAGQVAAAIRARNADATTLLDVACGSGEHGLHLGRDHEFRVDGVDVEPRFVEIAAAKNPDGRYSCADMADFRLATSYDAVVCLFGSIGYVRERDRLGCAISSMAAHLGPAGVLVVEPWFEPGAMEHGYTTCVTAERRGLRVCRMTHTGIAGRLSKLRFDYLIGTVDGVRHETELHELGLFTRGEMESAFATAGLEVGYDEAGLTGRGLYVGWRVR